MIDVNLSHPGDDPHTIAGPDGQPSPGQMAAIQAENLHLRAEVEQLRAERTRSLECQRRMMDLLGTKDPTHLVHDLRNVLNERELLRTLVNLE